MSCYISQGIDFYQDFLTSEWLTLVS